MTPTLADLLSETEEGYLVEISTSQVLVWVNVGSLWDKVLETWLFSGIIDHDSVH